MSTFDHGSFNFIIRILNKKLNSRGLFISKDFSGGLPRIEIYENDNLIDFFEPYVIPDLDTIETEEDEAILHRQAFIEMVLLLILEYYGTAKEDGTAKS